jgi:phosphatidylglycerophosphate synthase
MPDITTVRLLGRLTITIKWQAVRQYTPTTLSATRLLSPIYLIPLFAARWPLVFTGVAGAVALTDWLDGVLARRWKVETLRGAEIDIYADKALCVVLMGLALAGRDGPLLAVPASLLGLYHLVVIVKRVAGDEFFPASRVAKTKMLVEMASLVIVTADTGMDEVWFLGIAGLWTAMVLAVWSMCRYLRPKKMPDWPLWLWPRKA